MSLSGNIDLSSIGTETITGTVSGSTLNFGAVGSEVITYTGTVSGSSMSCSYTVQGAGGGNWTASHVLSSGGTTRGSLRVRAPAARR